MPQPLAFPPAKPTATRSAGDAIRTMQTIGIEWLDLAKQSLDDFGATAQRLFACRDPREAMQVHGDFLQRATTRALTRASVMGDQLAILHGQLLRSAQGPLGSRRDP